MKEVIDLNAKVTSARGKIGDINTRLKNMKTILANTPVEANTLAVKIASSQEDVNEIAKLIIGGFGAKNTVASRLRFASFAIGGAEVDVTGSQQEQLALAKDGYNGIVNALDNLFDTKLPALEEEFKRCWRSDVQSTSTKEKIFRGKVLI